MAEQFYTILTKTGKAKIANANALGNKLNLTKFVLGDGNGDYYNPTEEQLNVKNKVWEGLINSIGIDKDNPNWIVINTVIPATIGGFMIREAGVFDDEGNMIAIGKYPETYKPVVSEGSAKDLYINMIIEVSNTQNVTLKVDSTVILANKKDIEIIESKFKGLDDRVRVIETSLKESELDVLKTDVLMTPLAGCSGGFVNVESVQGKTEIINGKLVSVGEPVVLDANLFDASNIIIGQVYDSNGSAYGESTSSLSTQYIRVDSSKEYCSNKPVMILTYDSNKKFIERLYNGGADTIHRFKSNVSYIGVCQYQKGVAYLNDLKFSEIAYRVEILSETENLLDINSEIVSVGGDYIFKGKVIDNKLYIYSGTSESYGWGFKRHLEKGDYYISCKNLSNKSCAVTIHTSEQRNVSMIMGATEGVLRILNDGVYYISFDMVGNNDLNNPLILTDIMLTKGTSKKAYKAYNSSKTEISMQQPLRQWDSVDSNGVVNRGSGQVILNGSENWQTYSPQTMTNTSVFILRGIDNKVSTVYSDKFTTINYWDNDREGISVDSVPGIALRINKSRLTPQDLTGFKTWLSQNPVTVVYQLANPAIENTNKTLILRGYDNLIVNAGAVQPEVSYSYSKTSGGRFCSIENAVQVLKENVEKSAQDIKENLKDTVENLNKNNMKNDNDISAVKIDLSKNKTDINALRTDLSNAIKTIPLIAFGTADPTASNVPLNGIYIKI